jgi:hypothetical protein
MVAIIGTALHWSDIVVLFVYFLLILGFGVWVREIKEISFDYLIVYRVHVRIAAVLVRKYILFFLLLIYFSTGGYFLAGRSMHFIPVKIFQTILFDSSQSSRWARLYLHRTLAVVILSVLPDLVLQVALVLPVLK